MSLEDISFNSEFEKKAFSNHLKEGKNNYLALFMAVDPSINQSNYEQFASQLKAHVDQFGLAKLNKKNNEKKIKAIYNATHDKLFKKYELKNAFSNIFSEGYYNCVSASALYGIIFEQLSIPYSIKEKPTHVYVIAYPDTERILVESTDPTGGFITFNDRYKQAFVEQMKKAKLISAAEFENKPTAQLFDEYYFTDQEISMKELIGVQYTNDALYKIESNDLEKAFQQLEKAYLFYPSEKVITLMIAISADILTKNNYEQLQDVELLAKFSRFNHHGVSREVVISEFGRINTRYLITQGDTSTYRQFYEALLPNLRNDTLKQEISYLYHFERGRHLYNQGKYNESLTFFEQAYIIKPQHQEANTALVNTIINTIRYESDYNKVLEKLETYRDRHTGLMENNLFKSALINTYLIQSGRSFELNNIQQALKYKALFEEHYHEQLNVDAVNIGRVYSLAAIHYFRKGYTAKAQNIINQGLSYAPGNHELLVRKRMIK